MNGAMLPSILSLSKDAISAVMPRVLSQPKSGSVTLSEAKGLPYVGREILHIQYVPVQNDIIMKLTEY